MTVFAYSKRRVTSLAAFALTCAAGVPASAQFVPLQNYSQPGQPAYSQQAPGNYAPYPGARYAGAQHPMYAAPRVASAAVLPAPAEAINQAAPGGPQVVPAGQPAYQAPVQQAATNYQAAPATTSSWEGYTGAPAAGCATGNCGTTGAAYPTSGYGVANGAPACNVSSYVPAARRQWFVGVYGLYMQRNQPTRRATAVHIADTSTIGSAYSPDPMVDNFLWSSDAGVDGQFGGEIRFGSTFGQADACGGGQPFAWEIGYWQLGEDSSQATLLETKTVESMNLHRLYGRKNYAGLQYDFDGAGAGGFRPLNDYVDYQPTIDGVMPASNDIRVIGVRERQRFQMNNLELNFWRIGNPTASAGLAGGGLGLGGRGLGLGGRGAGGACRPPRRFFINGLAGIRYMRIDEDFQTAWQFTRVDGAGDTLAGEPTSFTGFDKGDPNVIFDDLQVDNQLVGFQLGCSMNWLVGYKWNLFADTNFGIYGNQANAYKSVFGGGFTNIINDTGDTAVIRSSRNNVAFVGEARFGVGYQVSCNCRLTAAYRIFGLSGIALAGDQATDWTSVTTASYINNNSALILQGLQSGVEWKY